jgi:alpha-maltose-1-phosphate synthase
MGDISKVALFTNEYPPHVYGGAGVHAEYLSRELSSLVPVEVRCFGEQDVHSPNLRVKGYGPWTEAKKDTDPRFSGALDAMYRSLMMSKEYLDASIVHAHTWYVQFAGFMAKKLWGIPFVLTTHSLEPLRPWKVEQLGNAYHLSSWIENNGVTEADAVIAVSQETRNDVLRCFPAVDPGKVHVIHNGIDLQEYCKAPAVDALVKRGVDPERPYVLFVGRVTRQKGIIHLVNAIPAIDPAIQVVLCAGAPDTAEIGREMATGVAEASAGRPGVIWIREMLPREDVIQFYSHASVFCCPSVYEPFGIINLEAMACETAVVASAVGGIPEVVVPGETGLLVDLKLKPGTFEPFDPTTFSADLAAAINRVALDPGLQKEFGRNGRRRVEDHFSWKAIAHQTLDLYQSLMPSGSPAGAVAAKERVPQSA